MAYDLTLSNNPAFVPSGAYGQSMSSGIGSVANVISGRTSYTLEARFKTTSTGGLKVLMGKAAGAWIGVNADGTIRGTYGGTSDRDIVGPVVNDGVFHHVALCVSATTGGVLFLDGVQVGTSTATDAPTSAYEFAIRKLGGVGFDWEGEVDEVAVTSGAYYTANFTPAPVSNNRPGLVAVWHLDGNGLDSAGLAGGGTATVPGAPTIGTAVAGDGYIDVAFSAPSSDGGSAILDYTATTSGGQTATGTTSPIRVTVPNGSAQTATVKARNTVGLSAASAASNSITPTAAGGGGAGQISISDTKVIWSPYTWDDRGTYKSSNNPGAFVNAAFTGTSFTVKVDVSRLVAAGVSAGSYPIVSTVVDGWSVVDTRLTSTTTTLTRSGLSNGAHTIEILFNATDPSVPRWDTDPINAVRITGFAIDPAGTLTQATDAPADILYGDSINEGWAALNTGAPAGNSARHTIGPVLAKALGVKLGVIGFSGIGYQEAGYDVPKIIDSFGFYSSGRSRLVGGLFSPQPRNIFCELGANGLTFQSDVQALITAFRAAAPTARIFMLVPAGGFARSTITAAVAANSSDTKLHLIDLGVEYQAGIDRGPGNQQTLYSVDGLHRNALSNARVAGGYIKQVQTILSAATAPVPVQTTKGIMNYADRVQETTTVTSAATITLTGAVSPMRTFSAAFAVGTKNIPVTITESTGKFESSVYTLTNATTLTRTAIVDSSNNGAAETFSAGSKNVFCTVHGKELSNLAVVKDVAFTSTIPLDQPGSVYMASSSVNGPLTFTAGTGSVRGALVYLRLTADGVNTPNFSAFKEWGGSSGYDNRAGIVNQLQFFYDGFDLFYSASQAVGATASQAPTSSTVPAAPTIGIATAGDGYIDVAFTRNSNGGSVVLDSTATLSTGQTATGTTSPIRVITPNGTPVTATVKDRNAVGLSAASAASNSVTPTAAAPSSTVRLNRAMAKVTESASAPWQYVGTGTSGTDGTAGAVSVLAMPAASDSSVTFKLIQLDAANKDVMFQIGTAGVVNDYGLNLSAWVKAGNWQPILEAGAQPTPTVLLAAATGDLVRFTRSNVAGAADYRVPTRIEVSKNNGTTWQSIYYADGTTEGTRNIAYYAKVVPVVGNTLGVVASTGLV